MSDDVLITAFFFITLISCDRQLTCFNQPDSHQCRRANNNLNTDVYWEENPKYRADWCVFLLWWRPRLEDNLIHILYLERFIWTPEHASLARFERWVQGQSDLNSDHLEMSLRPPSSEQPQNSSLESVWCSSESCLECQLGQMSQEGTSSITDL